VTYFSKAQGLCKISTYYKRHYIRGSTICTKQLPTATAKNFFNDKPQAILKVGFTINDQLAHSWVK
jgi:hypothetical protein